MTRYILAACLWLATASTAPVAHSADTNLTGNWSVTLSSERGKRETTMVLAQKQQAITGGITMGEGQSPVTGTITGNAVKLSYIVGKIVRPPDKGGEQFLMIDYVGTVTGDTITAQADSKEYGRVQMKAVKKR